MAGRGAPAGCGDRGRMRRARWAGSWLVLWALQSAVVGRIIGRYGQRWLSAGRFFTIAAGKWLKTPVNTQYFLTRPALLPRIARLCRPPPSGSSYPARWTLGNWLPRGPR